MNDEDYIMSIAGGLLFIGVLLLIPASILIGGTVTFFLWNWFIPAIFGITTLSYIEAIGISLVIGYFTTQRGNTDYEDIEQVIGSLIGTLIIKPVFVLLLGFVISRFI